MDAAAGTLVGTADSVRAELAKQLQRVLADLKELQARRDGLMTQAEAVDGLNGVLDAATKQKEAYATSNDPATRSLRGVDGLRGRDPDRPEGRRRRRRGEKIDEILKQVAGIKRAF